MKTDPLWLSGTMVCALMRKHQVTIAGLTTKFGLTKKRVREVRATGVSGFLACLLYTSDAADERSSVDLGGRRIIKKKTRRV